jgi:hypothetical protein
MPRNHDHEKRTLVQQCLPQVHQKASNEIQPKCGKEDVIMPEFQTHPRHSHKVCHGRPLPCWFSHLPLATMIGRRPLIVGHGWLLLFFFFGVCKAVISLPQTNTQICKGTLRDPRNLPRGMIHMVIQYFDANSPKCFILLT